MSTAHQLSRSTRYRKEYEYKRHRGIPTGLVDAAPVVAHVNRMLDLNWSNNALSAWTRGELSHHSFRKISEGEHATVERRTRRLVMSIPYTLAVPDHIDDDMFVAPLGATRRIQALYAMGWTRESLAPHLSDPSVSIAHVARGAYKRMRAERWRIIDDLYQRIHLTQGPSPIARHRAIANGYAPPLAFDNIDNPAEEPTCRRYTNPNSVDPVVVNRILAGYGELARSATKFERAAVIERWTGSESELNAITGWNVAREKNRAKLLNERPGAAA